MVISILKLISYFSQLKKHIKYSMQLKIKHIKKLSILLSLVVFSLNLHAGIGSDTILQKVRLQLKWKHQFQFAGYYAAIEKGYYKEAGLEVTLMEAVDNKNPVDEVFNGGADFGVATSNIVYFRANGKPVVVIAPIFQHSPFVILASKKSGINHVHDLAGKKLMSDPQAVDILSYIQEEGISEDKLEIMPHSYSIKQLINNEADAATAYMTDAPFVLQQAGFEYTIISPLSGGVDFYGDVLFTNEDMVKNSPELVEKFLQASLKGWKYAMNNPDEIIEIIYTKYSQSHSREHLKYEAGEMQNYIMQNVVEIGYSNRGRWDNIISAYIKLGLIKKDFNSKGLLYSDYIEKKTEIPWMLIGSILIVLSVVVFIAYFYYRLSHKLKNEIVRSRKTQKDLEKTRNELEAANIEILKDLESRKKTEAKVQKLNVAIEQSPTTIVITDITGAIEYANPKFTELTGYSLEEAIGKNPRILKSGKTDDKVFVELWKTITAGEIWQGEFINKRKDGSEFLEYATIAPIFGENGKITNYIAIKEDITIKKQIERELKESEKKLKELNTTKDKLFSIIGHDLRSPIGNLKSLIDVLIDNFDLTDTEALKNVLEMMKSSVGNTYELVENLLDWARLQKNDVSFLPVKTRLFEICDKTISLLQESANNKKITIHNQVGEKVKIVCDANMIMTVLRNLTSNAIKFTPDDRNIFIYATEFDDHTLIIVKDEGIGVKPEDLNKLFDSSLNFTTFGTKGEKGSGVGLILCREFVEKHGGKIWVESESGKGSEFKFTIPEPSIAFEITDSIK